MAITARLERYQSVALIALPCVWAAIVLSPGFATDADSYYHVGVARRLVEDGWLRSFEWLPHTTLADPYPNTAFGQHLVLAPLVALLGGDLALRAGILLLSTAFAVSVYLVLRRRGVRWPAPWIVLGLLGCPLAVSYSTFLKGASTFLVLLPWFVDAVWAGSTRRTFVLTWVSVYVYVGATVLVPFVIVHVLAVRAVEGRWSLGVLGAVLAGLIAGMVLNPLWPAHWSYVVAELRTIFERDPALIPGEYRGAEWAILGTDMLVRLAAPALVAWVVVVARRFAATPAVTASAASSSIAAFGLLAGGLLSGTKLVELFLVFSLLALPQLVEQLTWPRGVKVASITLALAGVVSSLLLRADMLQSPTLTRPRDYEAMGRWLAERTSDGEMVVAPWDDMPGLFMYGGDAHFMAGYNVQFLRDHDRVRFDAYALFYRGLISDPEQTMIQFFDGARLVLVRRLARSPGDERLAATLGANRAFEELASPNTTWRVWRRR